MLETQDAAGMELEDWEPRTTLVTKVTNVQKPAAPVVDAHNHLSRLTEKEHWDLTIREMDGAGVALVINLSGNRQTVFKGDVREDREIAIDKAIGSIPETARARIVLFTCPLPPSTISIHTPNSVNDIVAKIREDVVKGAKGVKIFKELGLTMKDENGSLIRIDEEALDPIWEECAKLDIPVLIHSADPAAFFEPANRFNEHWLTLKMHPDWQFAPPNFPTLEAVLEQRDNLLKRHPKTIFIGAHVGSAAHNLNYVSQVLDKYPNFYVDISARINELGRQPRRARRFIIEYLDRILFGTDLAPNTDYYRISYRFLETNDEFFLSPEGSEFKDPISKSTFRPHTARPWWIYGVDLPEKVLTRIYYRNAEKIIPNLQI